MRTLLTVGWTVAALAQAWVAYVMCFEVTSFGGYLPFMMFVLPMLLSGLLLKALADSD